MEAFGKNITYEYMNACCVIQSVIYQVLKTPVMVCLKEKVYWRNISLKMDKGCFITSEILDKNYCQFKAEKNYAYLRHAPNFLLRGTKYCAQIRLCSYKL